MSYEVLLFADFFIIFYSRSLLGMSTIHRSFWGPVNDTVLFIRSLLIWRKKGSRKTLHEDNIKIKKTHAHTHRMLKTHPPYIRARTQARTHASTDRHSLTRLNQPYQRCECFPFESNSSESPRQSTWAHEAGRLLSMERELRREPSGAYVACIAPKCYKSFLLSRGQHRVFRIIVVPVNENVVHLEGLE